VCMKIAERTATWRRGAAAVAALREVAGGRAGLLAEVAGVALGFCQRWRPDTPGSGHAVLSHWSAVCGEQVEGLGAVIFGSAGAGADGVEAGVAGQVGDDNRPGTPTAAASRQPLSDQFLSA